MKRILVLLFIPIVLITVVSIVLLFTLNFDIRDHNHPDMAYEYDYENIDFVSTDDYKIITAICNDIDYSGHFKKGNTEVYDFYKSKYKKLLDCEVKFTEKETPNEYYINEFGEINFTYPGQNSTYNGLKETYDPNNYIYYFFDMDGDDLPEFFVADGVRFIYIFKYLPDSDRFILFEDLPSAWRIIGSEQMWRGVVGVPVRHMYYETDPYGEEVWFYADGFYNEDTQQDEYVYMVGFSGVEDRTKSAGLLKDMETKGSMFTSYDDMRFYRITEKQYLELSDPFFETQALSEENIKEVSFSYKDLFPD